MTRRLEMTGEELTAAIERLSASPEDLAFSLGATIDDVRIWQDAGPPFTVALFLRLAIAGDISLDEAVERAAGLRIERQPRRALTGSVSL